MKGLFRTFLSTAVVALFAILFNTTVMAADGDLDTTFGTGGKVMIDFNGNPTTGAADQDTGLDMVIQPDGKIIIVGESNIGGGDSVMSATRLNADGTLDTTFATGGRFMYNAKVAVAERAYGVAVQADGKILIAGRDGLPRTRYVIRLNADGAFDTTFGVNGVFKTAIGSTTFDEPELAIQADGKIIVIGASRNGGLTTDAFSVMRITTTGVLDTTFDNDGEAVTTFSGNDRAYGVKLQSDGKVVVSGATNNGGGMALARYNTDGSLDAGFGSAGKMTATFPSASTIMQDLTILPNGKIIGAGYIRGQHSDAALIRFNADGTLDTTFGTNGVAKYGNTSNELFWDLQIKNNKIIAIGTFGLVDPSGEDDYLAVRFSIDGVLDTTFGSNGAVRTDFNLSRDLAFASAFQANGKLVVAGYSTPTASFNPDFSAVRLNFVPRDAPVDFNGDGKTDFSILRSASTSPGSQWTWWSEINGTGETTVVDLGVRNRDQQVPADYDGDGKTDIAMFRFSGPEAGNWYILQSSTGTYRIERFGQAGDSPTIVDDYDGDNKADLAVWRAPSAAQGPGQAYVFYRGSLNNPQGNITYIPWGIRYGTQQDQVDDIYTGDFDGDGKTDIAVQRRVDTSDPNYNVPAVFWIRTAAGNVSQQFFGWASDRIVPGDYDGDGKTDICVARGFNSSPSETTWNIRYSSGRPDEAIQWGAGALDVFAQGDYDGDGTTDLAVYRRAGEFNFYIRSSATGSMIVKHWGDENDIPIAGYNNR